MIRMEILDDFSGSADHLVVKGKRTKRPRPSSSASSSGGGGGEFYVNSLQVSSPATTTSSGISASTEEDEDMANCLILLARGSSPEEETKAAAAAVVESKFSSRKFTEMATSTNGGRVGIYVYECKTCNRTFPSFQALGGHRASHKKPKTAADNDRKKSPPPSTAAGDDQEERDAKIAKSIIPPPLLSTQSHSKSSCNTNDTNKAKIHECSICGSEFASGQALGGHMRRHRPAPRNGGGSDTDTTTTHDIVEKKPKNVFSLDLNLPAPPEDEKFHQFPAKQQPHLVFSAAALVDCHY